MVNSLFSSVHHITVPPFNISNKRSTCNVRSAVLDWFGCTHGLLFRQPRWTIAEKAVTP